MPRRALVPLLFFSTLCLADRRVVVSVIDSSTGLPVTGLQAGDFEVSEATGNRRVEHVTPLPGPLDLLFLIDTSMVGAVVKPLADTLIGQIQEREQMALVTFDSAATLVQDFTSSPALLRRALSEVKYGNDPRLLDGLYAALDTGFPPSRFRKVILLLTAGIEGPSRTDIKDVLQLARAKGVAIYPIFMHGSSRGLCHQLAQGTGGATFSLRELRKSAGDRAPELIYDAIRSPYLLTLSGNFMLHEKAHINIKGREKTFVSALPLD